MDWITLAFMIEFCASVHCYDSKFSSVLKVNYTNSFKSEKHFKGYENYQLSGGRVLQLRRAFTTL